MLFNSLHFLFFFPLVIFFYAVIKPTFRWILLLVASYYFYMSWNPAYILLILFSTIVDYWVAIFLVKFNENWKRNLLLGISLSANLGLLFYFKYFNFFNVAVADTLQLFGQSYHYSVMDILLPVGISFYTFQTLSYTIDVYNNRMVPVRHFGFFALYVSFFPQLVAGPIERPQNLFPQLLKLDKIKSQNLVRGCRLILWGLFKKMVIADRAAYFVNELFGNANDYHGFSVVLAMIFFSFQIYCDFSGYTDIAIGAAKIFGVDLMKNFRMPYFSKSIREFWGRWHISLSTWFRDYVYIPLGGNRKSTKRWVLNLYITFLISGIWHGANWTFIIWGAVHGLFIALESLSLKYKLINFKVPDLLASFFTFTIVTVAWVFFRADSVAQAVQILHNLSDFNHNFVEELSGFRLRDLFNIILPIPLIALLLIAEKLQQTRKFQKLFIKSGAIRMTIYTFLILLIAFYGVFRDQSDFIYFQF